VVQLAGQGGLDYRYGGKTKTHTDGAADYNITQEVEAEDDARKSDTAGAEKETGGHGRVEMQHRDRNREGSYGMAGGE
jgi:hypothetical protein